MNSCDPRTHTVGHSSVKFTTYISVYMCEHVSVCFKLRTTHTKRSPIGASGVVTKLPKGGRCETLTSYFVSVYNFKEKNGGWFSQFKNLCFLTMFSNKLFKSSWEIFFRFFSFCLLSLLIFGIALYHAWPCFCLRGIQGQEPQDSPWTLGLKRTPKLGQVKESQGTCFVSHICMLRSRV